MPVKTKQPSRPTVKLSESLHRKLKAEAALRGMKMEELAAHFIEVGLTVPLGDKLAKARK